MSYNGKSQIGTAWSGRHVIIITCNILHNQVYSIAKSYHAPVEPIISNCAEALSRQLSIGYSIESAVSLPNNLIQYVLVKK